MNEVQFVELARRCRTGDVVIAFNQRGERVGSGVVVSFVDPAKPLLVFLVEGKVVVEFFQDVFYAASPWIAADSLTVTRPAATPGAPPPDMASAGAAGSDASVPDASTPDADTPDTAAPDASMWAATMAEVFGMPFATDSERFDAYAAGVFGTLRTVSPRVSEWIEEHIANPSESAHVLADRVSIWEGYRDYAFS